MSDFAAVLDALAAKGLLSRATRIEASDAKVELLPVIAPIDQDKLKDAQEKLQEELMYGAGD